MDRYGGERSGVCSSFLSVSLLSQCLAQQQPEGQQTQQLQRQTAAMRTGEEQLQESGEQQQVDHLGGKFSAGVLFAREQSRNFSHGLETVDVLQNDQEVSVGHQPGR